jgi:hypothetical protein
VTNTLMQVLPGVQSRRRHEDMGRIGAVDDDPSQTVA